MHNTAQSPPIIAVADTKAKAREQAAKSDRGASALSLVKSARNQTLEARQCELAGDLKGALEAYIKAATLAKLCMDSAEFRAEIQPGKRGVLCNEFTDFTQVSGIICVRGRPVICGLRLL
ncbi:hypothetical protein FIBSPDRAFT_864751 [Athelia psychrophila]|uniref:Uncharacterized protein n=1 Tax=Athelia psychrophila TaxID=1759441 RepID=A0A166G8A2_9AGAM|nr:hypothetical protein FIBSPDRAFT_864751 [Fibularhizoctonia sp. CBS 109695]